MPHEPKGLNEECGVFGVWGNLMPPASRIFRLHTYSTAVKGAGIVGLTKDGMRRHYGLGLLSEVFTNTDQLTPLIRTRRLGPRALLDSRGRVLENIQPLLSGFRMKPLPWRIMAI